MKKLLGSHKFLGMAVCNHCGHKEAWSPAGLDLLREHIRECQPDLLLQSPPRASHSHVTTTSSTEEGQDR